MTRSASCPTSSSTSVTSTDLPTTRKINREYHQAVACEAIIGDGGGHYVSRDTAVVWEISSRKNRNQDCGTGLFHTVPSDQWMTS